MKKLFIVILTATMILTSGILAQDQVFKKESQLIGAALCLSSFGTPIEISYELELKEKVGVGASVICQSGEYDLGI